MSHSYVLVQNFSHLKVISDAIDDAVSQPEKEIPYSLFVQLFLNGGELSENTCRAMLRINENLDMDTIERQGGADGTQR